MLTGCQRPIALQSLLDVILNVHGVKIKVNTTGVIFDVKLPGVIVSRIGTRLYYRKLISDKSHDSKKLWWELHKVLHRSHGTTLPTHESSKSLADCFASFFSDKIMKICESFSSSESCTTVNPPFDPPKLTVFTQVTQDEIGKMISKSPTKSCLLSPLPTFLIKECIDILLPSITKLVNCSLREGLVPDGFKKAVVTPLIKKASLPAEDLKNYCPVSGLSFISKLVEREVAN